MNFEANPCPGVLAGFFKLFFCWLDMPAYTVDTIARFFKSTAQMLDVDKSNALLCVNQQVIFCTDTNIHIDIS